MTYARVLALGAALLLSACNQGKLTLSITDAPVDDAENIRLEITGVDLERKDGEFETFDFSPPKVIENALDLQGGRLETLLEEVRIEADDYVRIKLLLNADGNTADSTITLKDGGATLALEQDDDDPAEIEQGFVIDADEHLKLVIDFDLRRSILPPREPVSVGDPYRLRPVLRLVNQDTAGGVAGSVDASLLPAGCVPAVYLFTGASVTPDDAGSGTQPLTSAIVRDGAYAIGYIPAGDYTAALTCDADEDDPGTDDTFAFARTQEDISVATSQTVTVNFAAE